MTAEQGPSEDYLFDEHGNEYCRDCGHSHCWGAWNHPKVRRNRCSAAGIYGVGDCPCRKWNGKGPVNVRGSESGYFVHPSMADRYPKQPVLEALSQSQETRVRNLCELGWSRDEAEKAVRANP